MDKLVDRIARRCRWLAAAAIISVAVPAYFISRIEIDNSIEVWLDAGSSEYEAYRSFLDRYESEEFIVIAAEMDDPFSDKSVALQRELAENSEASRVLQECSTCRAYAAYYGKTVRIGEVGRWKMSF